MTIRDLPCPVDMPTVEQTFSLYEIFQACFSPGNHFLLRPRLFLLVGNCDFKILGLKSDATPGLRLIVPRSRIRFNSFLSIGYFRQQLVQVLLGYVCPKVWTENFHWKHPHLSSVREYPPFGRRHLVPNALVRPTMKVLVQNLNVPRYAPRLHRFVPIDLILRRQS